MPALIPAVVATSVKVSPCPSRTRLATAPNWRPTLGGNWPGAGVLETNAGADAPPVIDFLEKRATLPSRCFFELPAQRRFHALRAQFTLHVIYLHYSY